MTHIVILRNSGVIIGPAYRRGFLYILYLYIIYPLIFFMCLCIICISKKNREGLRKLSPSPKKIYNTNNLKSNKSVLICDNNTKYTDIGIV